MHATDKCRSVLFLVPTLHGGGSERVVINLLRHLDRTRYRAALAVVNMDNPTYRAEVPQDIELIDLRCSRVRYALPKIIGLVWRRKPDVVFTTLGHLNLALALSRFLLPDGIRYVGRESSIVSETLPQYRLSSLWRWAYRRYYHRFDAVVCQSQYMRDDLVTVYGVPAAKTVVIRNPIDIEKVRRLAADALPAALDRAPDDDAIHLVAAGRLADVKGFDLLIDAVALRADRRLRVTILGEGPRRAKLEERARERGVAEQIRFAGFQQNPYPFFAHADAFVLCSRHEGLPNVVLEALACGTPIVATPAKGGVCEILQGLDGCVLAKEISAPALAAALAEVIPGYRVSRDCVLGYEASTIMRRYEQIW